MTESQIRALLQSHPEQGEKALFDTYYSYAYAIVLRKIDGIGTREDAEECVIDVFLEVFRHFDDIRTGSLKAYIGTIAKNKASNVCRAAMAKSRRTESLDAEHAKELPSGQDVAAETEAAEQTRRVLQSIAALGEPDATILIQKYYYNRNAIQIAAMLGLKPALVRNRCSRALKKLRKELADLW